MEQAEEWGYRVLMLSGALLALGLALTITLVFAFIGVPLLILGSLLGIGGLVWMIRMGRRPVRELICGECEKPNRAFLDSGPFPCADCGAMLGEPVLREDAPPEPKDSSRGPIPPAVSV